MANHNVVDWGWLVTEHLVMQWCRRANAILKDPDADYHYQYWALKTLHDASRRWMPDYPPGWIYSKRNSRRIK